MSQLIPVRSAEHVAQGSVASKYSPAAYLAELWKEAKTLHPQGHAQALSSRRGDIGKLVLNQSNMDTEVSTLQLSNDLLASKLLNLVRYVLIRRTPTNPHDAFMEFTELEVFSGGVNIAKGKSVYSKTKDQWYNGQTGSQLVDGAHSTTPASQTSVSGDFWFLVDLETEYSIDSIKLHGRKTSVAATRESYMTLFALPNSALSAEVINDTSKMPTYAALMATPGIFSHTWTTQSDGGKEIGAVAADDVAATYTLTSDMIDSVHKGDRSAGGYPMLATMADAGYYHHPLTTLRGVLASLREDAAIFDQKDVSSVANYVYAGISPGKPAVTVDELAKAAAVWRLTQFHGVVEEEAQVMCGSDISRSEQQNETTGNMIPSQFVRLFGQQDPTLLTSSSAPALRKMLMKAFGVNDDGMTQLASLAGWTTQTAVTDAQVSSLYGWLLLSRTLGCSLAELDVLNKLDKPDQTWHRYHMFKGVLDWLAEQHLTVAGLLLLAAPYPAQAIPSVDNVAEALRRENKATGGTTRHILEGELSTVFGLSSASQAGAVVDWLDTDIPVGDMKSDDYMVEAGAPAVSEAKLPQVRFIMLRKKTTDYFDLAEVEVMSGGTNVALNGTVVIGLQDKSTSTLYSKDYLTDGKPDTAYASGHSNANAWIQIDLGGLHTLDSIRLTPRIKDGDLSGRMTDCAVYISDVDMQSWATSGTLASLPTGCILVGTTSSKAMSTPQIVYQNTQTYLSRLTQYMLVVRTLGLTEDVVRTLANKPALISEGGKPWFTVKRLRELSQLHTIINRCAEKAPAFLKQLSAGTLTVTDLGYYLGVDETVLSQASPGHAAILTFDVISQMFDTLQLSQRTGLSLANIAALRALKNDSDFAKWREIAEKMNAELPNETRTTLQQHLAEQVNVALCALLAKRNEQAGTTGLVRDADYFLIDLKASGQSLTSPLAWATASVQLYIDRCLNGDEPEVMSVANDSQFFADWDRYNKRYSQWAGLQQLLWEPENFIDPSHRLAQTEAFENMQQALDSGQLNQDTAEQAFYSYLTEFEKMAQVVTVNAWHDTFDPKTGTTWFIGKSRDNPVQWYWRSVDHSKLSAGALPVHAWTGWQKIDVPITLYAFSNPQPHIHLVHMGNRLHLLWVESIESKGEAGATVQLVIKHSQQQYDGSWSMPVEIDQRIQEDPGNAGGFFLTVTHQKELFIYFLHAIGSNGKGPRISGMCDRNGYDIGNDVFNDDGLIGTYFSSTYTNSLVKTEGQRGVGYPLDIKPNMSNVQQLTLSFKFDAVDPLKCTLLWTQDGKPKSYDLSTVFPTTLIGLAAGGPENIFALRNERKNPPQLRTQLDFYGSLGPYYWELFYHVPLMISQRLKQAQDYAGATRWQEYVFNPAGYPEVAKSKKVRYVMLRRDSGQTTDDRFDLGEVKVLLADGSNVAKKKTIAIGTQGESDGWVPSHIVDEDTNTAYAALYSRENSWVQIDLGENYSVNQIELTPRVSWAGRMVNCFVYVSDIDMKDWAAETKPGATDSRFILLGATSDRAQTTPQQFGWHRYWNPLPLESDYYWGTDGKDSTPTNTTDPDVIAEGDPMHYKLATLMQRLDLLLARGDAAYRLLERDTLVEAGTWYQKAQRLLGDKKASSASHPTLPPVDSAVKDDFKPQENEKLNGYWQQIRQRLYNLRHNLTLDGQPLSLPLYAKPANPADLLSAALAANSGATNQALGEQGLLRFSAALEQARGLAGQLVQFGSTLQGLAERQDAETLNQLLQTQGAQLLGIATEMQDRTLDSLDADLAGLQVQKKSIETRQTFYQKLYDENVSDGEQAALALNGTAAGLLIAGGVSHIVGGALDMAPNVFGTSVGGSRWGALANGIGAMLSNTASALSTTAGVLSETEAYRRRRQDWKLQLDGATHELALLDTQVNSLNIRREAAAMQKTYLLTQQRQTTEQLQFLKSRFTSQQLFSWLRSRLSTIFWQFYDITVSAALRAEQAYLFETQAHNLSFIRPGAWNSSIGGLLCGEALLLDLANMEQAWHEQDQRSLEVTRTVSLTNVMALAGHKPTDAATFTEAVKKILDGSTDSYEWKPTDNSSLKHVLKKGENNSLYCQINLPMLNIPADYPESLGTLRRVKNISVSLPALVGPYQDIKALLQYTGGEPALAAGCDRIAVSHGVNDSGMFQLDFNDSRYLPFEGVLLPTDQDKDGVLTLVFPNALDGQKDLLASLNDIILHIRYTIRK